ncbi:LSU ribosomal protein L33p [Myxococcus hansupus]|uniref:Large ribosomal subunit protein bL33 n=1 Tax=Pseudomyxococcus hansupus TaxID=1297742 RepID=A0A0H4WJD2_9BACT|nr:50S ribosomal protein L33 [Myxococcus hansupus]AKQ63446.1 LSU ribosomal protein L33p [Myxococcus hansupus]
MPKGNRTIIQLVSSAGTGFVYTTTKNKRKSQEKLHLRKYDPRVRKHVLFVEGKP